METPRYRVAVRCCIALAVALLIAQDAWLAARGEPALIIVASIAANALSAGAIVLLEAARR